MKAMEEDLDCMEVLESHFDAAFTVVPKRTTPTTVAFYEEYARQIM